MKKLLSLAAATLCISFSNAQQVKVSWGETSKSELDYNSFVNGKGTDMIKLCFESHGGSVFGGRKIITPILVRYNDKLAEMNVRKYEVDDKNIFFNNLLSIKGRIYLFTNQYDGDTKSTTFFCQPINIDDLNPDGKVINLGSFDAVNKSSQSTVGYQISKDSSKIMMFGLSPFSKKENEKYYVGVYDNNMKKLWDNTVELPYKDKFVTVLSTIVTNDGKVGVILKHYDQEVTSESVRGDGSRMPSYKTKFLLYESGNTKPAEFILNTGDKFVHTLQLTDDKDNNLRLFGLYKNLYNGYVSGFFTATIDNTTKQVSVSKMDAFPQELVEQIKIDKQGSDKEKDPGLASPYKLAQVIDRADGTKDYLLEYTSEVFHAGSSYYANGRFVNTPSYWLYRYGNIIDLSIKPNGKSIITRIPKLQVSTNVRIYSNFQALPYKDKLLLFYNDDRNNIERDLEKRPDDVDKFGKSILAMATIDAKGNLTRSTVLDHKEMDLTTCIRECRQIDKSRIGLYALKGGGVFSSAKDMVGILEVK